MNKYPTTRKEAILENHFGTAISDPYRWLEDDNSPETKEWVKTQQAITEEHLAQIPSRPKIAARLKELADYAKSGGYYKKGDYYYCTKNSGLQQQSVIYRQKSLTEAPELFFDPNTLSADGTTRAGFAGFSKDNKLATMLISESGSDWSVFKVIDLTTGEFLADTINWSKFSGCSWYKDGFYYSRYDEPKAGSEYSGANEYHKIYYHKIGTEQSADILVYEDPANAKRYQNVFVSYDETYLFLNISAGTDGNEIRYLNLAKGETEFKTLLAGFSHNHSIEDNFEDKFLVLTNLDADNYRLVLIDSKNPAQENWQTVIPEQKNLLEWVNRTGNKIFAGYLVDTCSRVYQHDLVGNLEKEIVLPTIGSAYGFGGNRDSVETFYNFNSFTYPGETYHYDLASGNRKLIFRPQIKFTPEEFESKQVFYPSKDGTMIPMFLVYKKGLELNGNNPVCLYGYGGFNVSLTPGFSFGRLPFIEKGGIYAEVCLRGGGEYGESWHKAGMLLNKQNVFDDFIAAAEFLIAQKYTCSAKLAISGGSNGGLLVGACMTQRPELFKAALPAVGVLDMLRYHKFTCGWGWIVEYGNPDEELHFHNILKYSPLHNLKPVAYPATMIVTADHDDRVVPAHSFKFASALQEVQRGDNPTLIRIETAAGHGGSSLSKWLETNTDEWAFIFHHLGMAY